MYTESDSLKKNIPVEGPRDTATEKFQKSLTPRLDDSDEYDLSNHVLSNYHACLQDRGEWEKRLVEWDDAYYNKTVEKEFPWPGASNFHVPIVMTGVEMLKPRLVDGVLGQIPPIMLIPTTGALEDRKEKVEAFLNWQVMTEIDIGPIVAKSAHLFVHPGLVVAKTSWKVERRKRRAIREFPAETEFPIILEALFDGKKPTDIEEDGELRWIGTTPTSIRAGSSLEFAIEFNYVEKAGNPIVQVLLEREEVTEKPCIDLVDPTDIIVPARGGDDPNKIPYIIQRLWMTENDLRLKTAQGRFYKDVVQDIISTGTPRGDQPTTDSSLYRQSQDNTEGIEGYGPSNIRRHQYEILETYILYDIDKDGIDEEIIVWLSPRARGLILGWDYLDNVYAHGRRPLRVGKYFPIPFRFYGLSFAEVVKGIQDEINAIHNQKVDYATLQNMPWFGYRASSSTPPIGQVLRPGQGIALDNPQQDIVFPKWQGDAAWANQEEATLMQTFGRLTGIDDLTLGRQTNRVGATRTAAGTQTLLSESGLRFKGTMSAFQQFWIGIFKDILSLDQEYLPPNKEFRITGKRPTAMQIKDRSELRGEFDIRLASSTEMSNRQKTREDATAVLQAIKDPIALQGNIIGMKGLRRGYKKFLRAMGEDPDLYLEDQAPILLPEEELMMFNALTYVSPVQGENIMRHLEKHQESLMDEAIRPEVKDLISRHLQETIQLMQQMQLAQTASTQKGGQQNIQGPQASNAQQGAAASSVQMNGNSPSPVANTSAQQ